MNTDLMDNVLVPTDEELVTMQFLYKLKQKLGNPTDLESQTGLTLLDATIGVWQKHFKDEARDWLHDVKVDLKYEKSLKELNKDDLGLINTASYPANLYKLIKWAFPDMKLQGKNTIQKLITIYPDLFKTSNYATKTDSFHL